MNLILEEEKYFKEMVEVLFEASTSITYSWNTIELCKTEIKECLDKFALVGFLVNEELAGFIGLREMYEFTYEIHPLMIKPKFQNQGIGTKLLLEIEKIAKENKIPNLILGTDDEFGKTSLSKIDLYSSDLFLEIQNIKNLNHHPFEFYKKNGYKIIGVVPDANGKNKPDILMGKRIV